MIKKNRKAIKKGEKEGEGDILKMEETGGKKKIVLIVIEWIIILLLAIGVYFGYSFYKEYTKKTVIKEGKTISVTITEGNGLEDIAGLLEDAGLVRFRYAFYLKAVESGYLGQFQPGTYELNPGMSLTDMMEIMCQTPTGGGRETVRFTIPEGYSVEMIGQRLEQEGFCTAEEFYAAASRVDYDFEFLKELPAERGTYALQGFLFPDTYEIYVGDGAEVIVEKMLAGFQSHLSLLEEKNTLSEGYSLYDLVTMASIVEREAKLAEERPTIAGVIYNRLNQQMKLQMCPTVLYVITDGRYDVNQVLYADLEVDDPYNTYVYEGLPKGPICCPGAASLEAAARPESHSWLFYHTDDEAVGNHIFTETYEEHLDTRIRQE